MLANGGAECDPSPVDDAAPAPSTAPAPGSSPPPSPGAPAPRTLTPRRAGALAGLIGGAALLAVVGGRAAIAGPGFTLPIAWIGATIYGDDAMQGGGQPVTAGLVIAAVVSAALGAAFERLTRGRGFSLPVSAGVGLAYGAVVWAVMVFGVVPAANPFLAERIADAQPAWLVGCLTYGLALGASMHPIRAKFLG